MNKKELFFWYEIIFGIISGITFFVLVAFSSMPSKTDHSQNDNSPMVLNDSFERIKLIATGDAMTHLAQIAAIYNNKCACYDYTDVFKYLPSTIKNSDIAFVNYETTNAGMPYSGFPKFSGPDTLAWFLKSAGFNFIVNANNHSNDKGLKGIYGTLNVFDRNKITHTGVFRDSSERNKNYPVILNEKGFKIAVLNYTYGTNENATPKPAIVNLIDTNLIKQDMQKALNSSPDAVIVLMHWGVENQREPNFEQKALANFLFRNGADIIVGSHPHTIQPIEYVNYSYKGKNKTGLVIWSLGNFISNQRKRYNDGGMFVCFDIARNIYTGKIKIDNTSYIPYWVYKKTIPVEYHVLPISMFENNDTTFQMNQEEKEAFKTFISDTRKHLARDTARIKEMKSF